VQNPASVSLPLVLLAGLCSVATACGAPLDEPVGAEHGADEASLTGPQPAQPAPRNSAIVFRRDEASGQCWRIPSLAAIDGTYVAVAERRHELAGSMCNDDGDIDLVAKSSADGRTWSAERVILSSAELKTKLKQPSSVFFDPSVPVGLPDDRMYVRLGNQAMANVDGRLVVVFQATYNIVAACGGRPDCVNSPENVTLGAAKDRYFSARSDDRGKTWTIRRVHHDVSRSCVESLVTDDRLKKELLPLFPDENYRVLDQKLRNDVIAIALDELGVANTAALQNLYRDPTDRYEAFLAKLAGAPSRIARTTFLRAYHTNLVNRFVLEMTRIVAGDEPPLTRDQRSARISTLLGVPKATIDASYPAVSSLFRDNLRAGPGNAVAFQVTEGGVKKSRLFVPGAPLAFFSDDRGDSWQCADTTRSTAGSERQPADLGGGRLVMTMRNMVDKDDEKNQYRRFAESRDSGKTWGEARFLENAQGARLLPDPISNAGLIGIGSGAARHLVLVNLANNTASVGNGDERRMLTLTRFAPGSLEPILEGPCPGTQVHRSQYTVWNGSAAYAVLAQRDPSTLAVMFEASDDRGPELAYRSWNESIRFVELPLSALWTGNPTPECPQLSKPQ